jgi:hypothetical protein
MDSRTPSGLDLFKVFQGVLSRWAYLPSEYAGEAAGEGKEWGLSLGVSLEPEINALLVVRGRKEFGDLLLESTGGEPARPSDAEDSFRELVNLCCGHLLTTLWPSYRLAGFLPVPVPSAEIPSGPPSVSCALKVENQPVEILVWMKPFSPPGNTGHE